MTETTTSQQEQPGPAAGEPCGVDLARVALHQAREAAKTRGEGGTRKTKRRTRTAAARRDGREPTGFATVLQGLLADRAWDIPAVGGSVLDRWPDIAAAVSPQLPSHVTAAAFHPETKQLDLRPDSPAYATQLRLISSRIVATVNSAVGTGAVRTVRVLPVGAAPAPRTPQPVPAAAAMPGAPVKTRETASSGYKEALAVHRAVTLPSRIDASITEAVERQTAAMRALSRQAFPEPDDAPAPIETALAQRRRQASASHAAALRRARAERAGASAAGPEAGPVAQTA
ncbi:hypothetical protein GCM10020367_71600 [Streptomyces sannanensis]|uniref:DUF721 domain-containing protein n=1 Tax=Streptomyces sannanensis TaxID=285536 RepID=A0ABP6SNG3_9ACTN